MHRILDAVLVREVNMKCPVCGQSELVTDARNLPYTYKNQTVTIQNVTGEYCEACGEVILKNDESRRVMELMAALSNG